MKYQPTYVRGVIKMVHVRLEHSTNCANEPDTLTTISNW